MTTRIFCISIQGQHKNIYAKYKPSKKKTLLKSQAMKKKLNHRQTKLPPLLFFVFRTKYKKKKFTQTMRSE